MVSVSEVLLGILVGLVVFCFLAYCLIQSKEGFGKVLPFFTSAWGVSIAPAPRKVGYGAPAGIWNGWVSYAFPYPNSARVPPVPQTDFRKAWKVNSCETPYEASPWMVAPSRRRDPRCLIPANAFAQN